MVQLLNCHPDGDVKESALKMAKRHLWYLSETNVGLAFLDERITDIEKEKMFQNLEKPETKKRTETIRWKKPSL